MLVYPVGATLPTLPELKSSDGMLPSIQEALEFVLVETAKVCSDVNSSEIGENAIVEMNHVRVKAPGKSYERYLGSIPASMAATVLATIRTKPVSIVDETDMLDKKLVRLKVWSEENPKE